MEVAASTPAWVLIAYLIAGICFILALRGLSSPSTSQRGNRLGMIGMGIAVGTTLLVYQAASPVEIHLEGRRRDEREVRALPHQRHEPHGIDLRLRSEL